MILIRLIDLNETNNEGEGNPSAIEVLQAVAQQLIEELMQNPPGHNRNRNERGCTMEQFNRMHPPSFDGKGKPTLTEDWVQDIKEILRVLNCIDEQKVSYTTFKLTGEAKQWWIPERTIGEADGRGVFSWRHFKQIFVDHFLPRSVRDDRARKFANLVQGTMTIH
ncbi:uncharacterized protein LOC122282335 [Carya illinoinensis]|uniref:uncharacterized protein LOC122282335 n=1 Tax=Carya illinoinensis TaxID=32201 RepID=UPI001C720813|nr:uncharacterized protein LOC122282335 [Carya illinoinensis]